MDDSLPTWSSLAVEGVHGAGKSLFVREISAELNSRITVCAETVFAPKIIDEGDFGEGIFIVQDLVKSRHLERYSVDGLALVEHYSLATMAYQVALGRDLRNIASLLESLMVLEVLKPADVTLIVARNIGEIIQVNRDRGARFDLNLLFRMQKFYESCQTDERICSLLGRVVILQNTSESLIRESAIRFANAALRYSDEN